MTANAKAIKRAPREKREHTFRRTFNREQFAREIARQIRGRGHNYEQFIRGIFKRKSRHTKNLLRQWANGELVPRWPNSFRLLNRIEERLDLPKNHFRRILISRSKQQLILDKVVKNQQQFVRWHLPSDFDTRSSVEQDQVFEWIKQNVLRGGTDYGQYIKNTCSICYTLRLPRIHDIPGQPSTAIPTEYGYTQLNAPARLVQELSDLVAFKRSTIAPPGLRRFCGWTFSSGVKQIRTIGRMFGALTAPANSRVIGFGAPLETLTLALWVFPAYWDWYLQWCERRRGFFTALEVFHLHSAISLFRKYTGWARQNPELAKHLAPVSGLITEREIEGVRSDWDGACDRIIEYSRDRIRELRRINRPLRDPFIPITVILKKEEPLNEYRKIADEVLRRMPDARLYPTRVAEFERAYLMLRFGLHLGLRQRNLRELLFCLKGGKPKSEAYLQSRRCGELRWITQDNAWVVHIPAIAFKNWDSNFFRHGPFHAILPDLDNLYSHIDAYLRRHRAVLLGGFGEASTFFVRTMRTPLVSPSYDGNAFNREWNDIIRRFGVYNPYTGHGAIEGLLPHGPNSVRDVIATHMLKQSASFELAAFAIQDNPETIKAHYGRFLPEEKSALAARVLNRAWL
jgi:hypothetical protein